MRLLSSDRVGSIAQRPRGAPPHCRNGAAPPINLFSADDRRFDGGIDASNPDTKA
jgi:hypothetical protein